MISSRLRQQFIKYVLIGFLNFSISTGLMYLMCQITHIFNGWMIYVFSAISFTAASTNSYFCNRFWTFKDRKTTPTSYPLFYTLTLVGWAIGSTIVFAVTTYVNPVMGISRGGWVIVANVVSVGFSMVWNFTAYSQVVFRAPAIEAAE